MPEDRHETSSVREGREDTYVQQAEADILALFDEYPDRVFYYRQLSVLFEHKYFHWVTNMAAHSLVDKRRLATIEIPFGEKSRLKFVFRRGLRYYRRIIQKSVDIVRRYSEYDVAEACGQQAELLFLSALAERGFVCHGREVNAFRGKQWIKTNHDLDFIIERDQVVYGVEVKNRLDYVDRHELQSKLEMCEFLGLRPLMIMRSLPKTYVYEIMQYGGFALVFEAQIYPFGSKPLVRDIQEVLGLKADCPRAIPSGIIDRFLKWHGRVEIKP